jgi:hypothetical protein
MNKFNCGLWTKVQPQDMAETKEFPRVKPLAQWSPYIDYSEQQEQEQTKAFFLGTLSELASLTILCTTIYILIKMM